MVNFNKDQIRFDQPSQIQPKVSSETTKVDEVAGAVSKLTESQLETLGKGIEAAKGNLLGAKQLSHSDKVLVSEMLDKMSEAIEHAIVAKRENGKPVTKDGNVIFVKATSIPREELEERHRNNDVHFQFNNMILINPNAPGMANITGAAIEGEHGEVTPYEVKHLTDEQVQKLSKAIKFHINPPPINPAGSQEKELKHEDKSDQHNVENNRTANHLGPSFIRKKDETPEEHTVTNLGKHVKETGRAEDAAKVEKEKEKDAKAVEATAMVIYDGTLKWLQQQKEIENQVVASDSTGHTAKRISTEGG